MCCAIRIEQLVLNVERFLRGSGGSLTKVQVDSLAFWTHFGSHAVRGIGLSTYWIVKGEIEGARSKYQTIGEAIEGEGVIDWIVEGEIEATCSS